jgi:hypothetical protein
MFVVADRFNHNDDLRWLLERVPKSIDLGKYLSSENKKLDPETKYLLSGFIFQDLKHKDYVACLKNKKR